MSDNSTTTNSIHRETKYFKILHKRIENTTTITCNTGCIVGSNQVIVILPNDIRIFIEEVLLYLRATHTLLMIKDICHSGYHVTTMCEEDVEYLHITISDGSGREHYRNFLWVGLV
jgi:hypothetical protein